jgi:hypothetical protein
MRSCARDGGGPSGIALQGEVPNHRKLLRSRAVVASVAGNGALIARQVRAKKANMGEPLDTCRNSIDDAKTEVESLPREEPGGNLLTAQVVSGIKVARSWFRPWCGTWEPGLRHCDRRSGVGTRWLREEEPQAAETARGRVPVRSTGADRLVVATMPGNAGGAKEAGCLGSLGGQPSEGGRSR